jgi:adenylate cyclase
MTVLFVVVERYVALKLVKAFDLPPDTGAIVAGGVIAATFVPIRRGVTRLVTRLAERWLPVSAVVDGERVFRAVAITDLSGYTALAATDDAAARMQSGVLKRAAQLATEKHGGRIVKTLGDAVMMVYETSRGAALAVRQIHQSFPAMVAPLGYTPLPLHSAVHYGEIAETHDGDIFGHTVNVTARLVDIAKGGEIALSADAAGQAQGLASLTDAGAHRLKNVPEAIHCFKLGVDEPSNEANAAA